MQTIKTILLLLLITLQTHSNIPPQTTYNETNQPLVIEYEDGSTVLGSCYLLDSIMAGGEELIHFNNKVNLIFVLVKSHILIQNDDLIYNIT